MTYARSIIFYRAGESRRCMTVAKERSIYILLTDTGTIFTRLIRWYTGDPMNHASLVLGDGLKEIYSFGRLHPRNPFSGGLVMEDLEGKLFGNASCALYRCTVSEQAYEQICQRVEGMLQEKGKYKYNLLGLLGVAFNVRLERAYAYFCSQFVASVFEFGGAALTGKPAALVTPGDLALSPALRLVYRGEVRGLLQGEALAFGDRMSA